MTRSLPLRFLIPSAIHWLLGLVLFFISVVYPIENALTFDFEPAYFVYGLLTPFALAFFQSKVSESGKNPRWHAGVFAVLFAICTAFGKNYYHYRDWYSCFNCKLCWIVLVLQCLIYAYITYHIALGALCFLHNLQCRKQQTNIKITRCFLLFVCVRLVYFAAFYPGIFDIDAAVGLRNCIEPTGAICSHHPVFVQALHVAAFSFGQAIGHLSVGFAMLCIISILCSSLILTYGIRLSCQAEVSSKLLKFQIFAYTIFPFFPFLSILITKDGFFAYSFLLYMFTLYELLITRGCCMTKPKYQAVHGLAILLVCLTRNQGFIIIFAEFFIILLAYRHFWLKTICSAGSAIVVFLLYSRILLPALNVEPGGKQELYGTLFQQTAYYYQIHKKYVTPEEHQAVSTILDIDQFQNFEYSITDPIKDPYKYNPLKNGTDNLPTFQHIDHTDEDQELHNYLKAWASMGRKHPLCYVRATTPVFLAFFYNRGKPLVGFFSGYDNPKFTTPKYCFWHYKGIQDFYEFKCIEVLAKTPILSWLGSVVYYNWVTILFILLLIFRRDRLGIALFFPIIISLGILLVCPVVNGRYAFPIVVSLPLFFTYLLSYKRTESSQSA